MTLKYKASWSLTFLQISSNAFRFHFCRSSHLGGGSSPIKSPPGLHLLVVHPEAARQVIRRHPTFTSSYQRDRENLKADHLVPLPDQEECERRFSFQKQPKTGQQLYCPESEVQCNQTLKFEEDLGGELGGSKPEHPETCSAAQHNGGVWS